MTPDEKADVVRRMIGIQDALHDIRDYIEIVGAMAKKMGAFGLSFASFHLSDSIAVYANEVARFFMEDEDGESKSG